MIFVNRPDVAALKEQDVRESSALSRGSAAAGHRRRDKSETHKPWKLVEPVCSDQAELNFFNAKKGNFTIILHCAKLFITEQIIVPTRFSSNNTCVSLFPAQFCVVRRLSVIQGTYEGDSSFDPVSRTLICRQLHCYYIVGRMASSGECPYKNKQRHKR